MCPALFQGIGCKSTIPPSSRNAEESFACDRTVVRHGLQEKFLLDDGIVDLHPVPWNKAGHVCTKAPPCKHAYNLGCINGFSTTQEPSGSFQGHENLYRASDG